ncbi:PAS domain S-box protein [Pseudanabaena sp. 'Roaring Creek']|uniref:PAS domain S-box protein n=1 Tax=Pseudanabaena sp. 'Roaring Creek' TaxID=1681830 RepID=UPI0006D83465|nr:PAS domain S-box protein [Pseudanabaena sp. 'Roaring Creek']
MTSFFVIGTCFSLLFVLAIATFLVKERKRRYRTEKLLIQQSDRERLVTQIALQIRQSLDLDRVLSTTVTEVQRFLQADRVLIYRLWSDGTGSAIHETVLPPYPSILGQVFPEEVFPAPYHRAYSLGKILTIANVEQCEMEVCLRDFVKQFGVRAKLVVPIIQENRDRSQAQSQDWESPDLHQTYSSDPHLWGILIAHQCSQSRTWEPLEVELMKQLATQVAIAIQQSELYKQLQEINTQLEQRVQQRTTELASVNNSLRAEILERQRTEIALRYTNETLQALVNASPRAIFMLDLEGKVKIWNPAAEQMFGWKEAEVINQPSPIRLDDRLEDCLGNCTTLQNSVLQGKTYTRVELSRPKKDGSEIDIIFSAAPLTDVNDQIGGIVAVIADITEQKRQAEQVRLLQSVVVNTNDAVIVTEAEPIDAPGPRILYVNEAFTRITGYQPHEVLGKTPRILQGEKTDRSELQKVRKALSVWESVTVEVINYRKDGSEFWNEFSLVPVANSKGWYTHWIAVQRDTTERKQVEQALRYSEQRFRSLIENALDIIMIIEPSGAISYVSPSVEKVLGYSVAEMVGAKIQDFVHGDDWMITRDRLTHIVPHPDLQRQIEFRHRHQDGTWRILEAISQPFVDSADTLLVMVNARDITERKRLDETRLALVREKELSILKTRFFSMASHEFRTPLSTALAAAQVLENSPHEWDNAEKRLRNLHRIQDAVRNMVQLLDDILTINRAETGKLAFNPKSLSLEAYCRHFVEEMQLNAGNHHNLTFNCQGDSRNVYLDEKLWRSLLANLLSNAIKYSPQGGDISLDLEFQLDRIILTVADRGIGIPLEDQKQLFEPFHRGKNVKTISGTGLGLVVVKKCVDLHQGTIEIKSEVGLGTICRIAIPLQFYN